jgi:hypothetical protein
MTEPYPGNTAAQHRMVIIHFAVTISRSLVHSTLFNLRDSLICWPLRFARLDPLLTTSNSSFYSSLTRLQRKHYELSFREDDAVLAPPLLAHMHISSYNTRL